MSGTGPRQKAFRRGLSAETQAAWLLRLKGYRILARRYRTPRGEADLVARRGSTLVFVEVKARGSLEAALLAIRPAQMRRIADAARTWLAHHPGDMARTLRFDAVCVAPGCWPRHIERVFEADI